MVSSRYRSFLVAHLLNTTNNPYTKNMTWPLDLQEWTQLIEEVPAFSIPKYVEPLLKRRREYYQVVLEDCTQLWTKDDYDTALAVWQTNEEDLEALSHSLKLIEQ